MEIRKKKRIIRKDEASDWLQIWTAASLLDVKDKAIKKLPNHLVFPKKRSHVLIFLKCGVYMSSTCTRFHKTKFQSVLENEIIYDYPMHASEQELIGMCMCVCVFSNLYHEIITQCQ